jgi:2-polyprenyl-6-methoxyphenol hydroxylase-like FAD-dependent oxidoreductase
MRMTSTYDAIVVGARCAGAPTAMLLARKGYRILLVDRATFPSDTLSTHVIQPLGVSALSRWGLLERLVATGCPAIDTYTFDFGQVTIAGTPGTSEAPVAYCPRRTVLDKLLVDAAAEAGAEIRENFDVEEVMVEDGRVIGIKGRAEDGTPITERARVVVGADGRNSLVARTVRADEYNVKPPLLASYYAYWSGLPMNRRFEIYIRPRRGFGVAETHDGLTMVIAGWPISELEANRKNIEGNYLATLGLVPEFAERLRSARRETRLFSAILRNFFRKPYGPGWVLVGDAGYHKDSITAQGITDAFRDAERCTAALDQAFAGTRTFEEAMTAYQRDRDDHARPMYEFTCGLATLEPPPPEMQKLIAAIHGRKTAMDAFAQMNAGTVSPAEFFAPQNIGALMAAA